MSLILSDRVKETCSSPGTGAVTLLGAQTGFQAFSTGVGNGNTCYYTISDQAGTHWEVGIGTYSSSGNTLTRTTPLSGSSTTPVNFSSGTQDVFVTYPAEKAVTTDIGNAVSSTTATNLAGGSTYAFPYQSASGNTAFLSAGTSGSLLMTLGTIAPPTWVSASSLTVQSVGNSLTFNNGGSGSASGTSFNGGTAYTISYNTIGASPLAGSTSITTLGTITTGTWNASVLSASYGGTGEAGTLTGILYGNGTSAHTVATTAQLLSGIGTLPVSNGGTGLTSLTANYIPYGNGTGAFNSSSNLVFDGNNLGVGSTLQSSYANSRIMFLGLGGMLESRSNYADYISLYGNTYISAAGNATYIGSSYATRYLQIDGQHIWYTAPSGTAGSSFTFTQVMQTFPSGGFSLGNTTDPGASNLFVSKNGYFGTNTAYNANDDAIILAPGGGTSIGIKHISGTASSAYYCYFTYGGSIIGSISQLLTTGVSFNVTSDQRLKTDLGISTDTSVIDNTLIHDFSWKTTGSKSRGVFAQEAILVKPEAVVEGQNEDVNSDGLPTSPWGVDYSKYVPDLIVYCQQLKATINSLESKLKSAGVAGF
jgi:hypothetical protein